MAVKVNYKVKVINTPKGLGGYSKPSYTSSKVTTYKNGTTMYVDRMDTDTSGIWYRNKENKSWVLYKTSSGKAYLKVLSNKVELVPSGDYSLGATKIVFTSTGVPMKTINSKDDTTKTSGKRTAKKISSKLPKTSSSNISTTSPKKGLTKDIVQQNPANYPPVKIASDTNGNIWYDWTINMNVFAKDILNIKKNLNVPSAYNRLEIAKLTHTKFNRYKINYGDYNLKPTIAYVVFTRPDLNLFDSKKKLLPQISNDPQLYYIWKNNPSILKQLSLDYAGGHKFIPLLTNQVTALDILDESIDTIETGETWSGYKMQYAKHSIRSLASGSVSVKFPETNDLSITQMFQTWCSYESGVYRGTLIPKEEYCMYKILDYACDIYYFLMDRDMTIRFWSVYYGAFPTNVNKSIFSFDMGSDSGGSDVNVTFAYFHKLDMDTRSLVDFNNISGGVKDGLQYKLNVDPSICLGGGGSTWSGAPFVEAVKCSNGMDTVDELKLRFRA